MKNNNSIWIKCFDNLFFLNSYKIIKFNNLQNNTKCTLFKSTKIVVKLYMNTYAYVNDGRKNIEILYMLSL